MAPFDPRATHVVAQKQAHSTYDKAASQWRRLPHVTCIYVYDSLKAQQLQPLDDPVSFLSCWATGMREICAGYGALRQFHMCSCTAHTPLNQLREHQVGDSPDACTHCLFCAMLHAPLTIMAWSFLAGCQISVTSFQVLNSKASEPLDFKLAIFAFQGIATLSFVPRQCCGARVSFGNSLWTCWGAWVLLYSVTCA